MPRPMTEEDDVRAGTTWSTTQDVEVYGAVEPTNKSSMTTLQHPDVVGATPTMPKKVSFAAEVDEQQERISKESGRRDACCSIQ